MHTLALALGAAIAIGISALATAHAQARIGSAGMGTLAERPEMVGPVIISIALPETMVILGFVIATMIILMVK
ncbi:MAG: ATPase [Candidatus Omnitrophica bacterium]|nr:ATPase [Candidatus Omnitrophota bacterium]